jgi:hypothetical protein
MIIHKPRVVPVFDLLRLVLGSIRNIEALGYVVTSLFKGTIG